MFLDRLWKKEIASSKDDFTILWGLCIKLASSFARTLQEDIKKLTGIDITKTGLFADEILMLNIWILHKALPEHEDALKAIRENYISKMGAITGDQKNTPFTEQRLLFRLRQYFSDWDDLSGTNQSTLSLSILENILHGEDFDKKTITNFLLLFSVQTHIFSAIATAKKTADQF